MGTNKPADKAGASGAWAESLWSNSRRAFIAIGPRRGDNRRAHYRAGGAVGETIDKTPDNQNRIQARAWMARVDRTA